MPGHQLGLALDALGKPLDEHVHHPPVELLARALEQRLVRRHLHERVLERVRRLRRLAALKDDLRVDQPRELLAETCLLHPGDGGQQRIAELPPEHRRPLRHSFAVDNRSSRAISEPASVDGIASALLAAPGSATAFVSSST